MNLNLNSHTFYSNLFLGDLKDLKNLKNELDLKLNLDYTPGIIHISGKNGSGKTTFIKKKLNSSLSNSSNSSNSSNLSNLSNFILELTPGKLADYLLGYFNNIPFDKISCLVKQDILKLANEIAFEQGKIKGNSITFEKEKEMNVPQETLEILVDLETKMKNKRVDLTLNLNDKISQKIGNNIKSVKGVYFTQDYILGSNPILDELYSDFNCISKTTFLESQLRLKLLEKDHFSDHTEHLNIKKYTILQNKIQEKYSKISVESISEIKVVILEKEKQLKKLKKYKSELTTRKYQKEILKLNYLESTKFVNEKLSLSLILPGRFSISEKGTTFNKVKFNELSGSEKVILEIFFRIYLNDKLKFDFICIDELLDRISDINHIKMILDLLFKNFKFVFLVTHRKDIIENTVFSEVINI